MKKRTDVLRTVFADYALHDSLGEGGSGVVYRATDTEGREHAIKILDPSKATHDRLARFKNEILFGLRTTHRNVVRVEDYGVVDVAPFYVMPLFPQTLRRAMREGLGPESLRWFGQMLSGLEAAHLRGVFHRDLKPENCLISRDGDLVVADWGTAHFEEEDLYVAVETRNQDRLANFVYAAPEQRIRGGRVGSAADIFAAGLIINEMFTGEVIQGTGAKRIAQVSREHAFLDDLVDEMIQQDPAARPTSIDDVKLRLDRHRVLFESRQKLDALNAAQVVPITTSDDPLVREPVRIVAYDYDAGREALVLRLNHQIGKSWADTFFRVHGVTLYPAIGLEPGAVDFTADRKAVLRVEPDRAGEGARLFQEWLARANSDYAEEDKKSRADRERAERAEFDRRRQQEEARHRALRQLPQT